MATADLKVDVDLDATSEQQAPYDSALSPISELSPKSEITIEELPVLTTTIDEKALLSKIDWQLIPWLSLLFFLSFLDRTSIGNAKLYNMEADLGITDNQYLIALTIFFIPYSLIETPSNILLKKLSPRLYLSWMMLIWGVMMTVQGLVHNYGGLMTQRWWLGFFEGGLFPGVMYYLSSWYKRSQLGIRSALFFSAASVSGSFGGLIAAAISKMDGVGGKPAWAWIFIIQGLATIVVGFFSFWVVQDFPAKAKFITEEERAVVIGWLLSDDQLEASSEKFQLKDLIQSLRDWKTWIGVVIYGGIEVVIYATALFTPSIINQLGYTATPANLLSVPVYVWACLLTCTVGYVADRRKTRGIFNLIFAALGATGYIILILSRNAALSYFGVYLGVCIYPLVPNTITWIANNVEGNSKRGISMAMVIGLGNLHGIISSNVYRAQYQPWYTISHGIVLAFICITFIGSAVMLVYMKRENAARDRGERDETIGEKGIAGDNPNGVFSSIAEARSAKGDEWSGFRYTL